MSIDHIKVVHEAASEFEPEPPRPLRRQPPHYDPYPVEALGEVLGPATLAIHDKVQAAPAICAQSVLGAAALAVQGHADVVLPTGDIRPVSLFLITVAASGERKTTADERALVPVRAREEALRDAHKHDVVTYKSESDVWEKHRTDILKNKKFKTRQETAGALKALGSPPDPPLVPMLTAPEPTYEGLVRLLTEGHPSVGVFSSEGARLIGGHAFSREHRLKTAGGLSEVWEGQPIRRVRAADGSSVLPGRRVSLHLMFQPGVAMELLMDPMLEDQGLLSRMLVTHPPPATGTRQWHEPAPESKVAIEAYYERILSILNAPLPLKAGTANELEPRQLPLSKAARELWIGLVDGVEEHIGPCGHFEPIRAFANKLPEHATRLAAVMALVHDLDCAEVSDTDMDAGIRLAAYYADEGRRLMETGATNPDLALAERLLEWLHDDWKNELVTLPNIYQRGPYAIRDKQTASRIVAILVDHEWLIPVEGRVKIEGVYRREVWKIVEEETT